MPKFKKVVKFHEGITEKKNKLLTAANEFASRSIILQVYIIFDLFFRFDDTHCVIGFEQRKTCSATT